MSEYLLTKKITPFVNNKEEIWGRHGKTIKKLRDNISYFIHWHSMVASGARTICLPELVKGVSITDKILDHPGKRFADTYRFFDSLISNHYNHSSVKTEFNRTNSLHKKYKVALNETDEDRDFFKYILFNLFVIAFQSLPIKLTPEERHALFELCVLIADRMGHTVEGSVLEFEKFIIDYEKTNFFSPFEESELRTKAANIANNTVSLLQRKSWISLLLVQKFTPRIVRCILKIN